MQFHLKLIEKCIVVHGCLWSFGFLSAMETASDKELPASATEMVCSLSENSKERKENKLSRTN